jgi:heptosyltransferase III
MKILLVSRAKLGDLLLTTPTLQLLRTALPQAEIHLLGNEYNIWVVDGNSALDKRWTFGRFRTGRKLDFGVAWRQLVTYGRLKRERFDVAIAAGGHESHRAITRTLHAGARCTVAYANDPKQQRRVTDFLVPDETLHESIRMAKMLEVLGVPVPATLPAPTFHAPAFMLAFADGWLASRGLAPRGYLLIGIGSRSPVNQPQAPQVLRLARWAKESHGLDTVFMWTPGAVSNPLYPGDDDIAQPVLDAKAPYIHPFRGPLKEAIGLIMRARTSMFPDSGMMHFAAASPGGVLGLFADTKNYPSPVQWAPLGPRASWLEAKDSVAEFPDTLVTGRLDQLLAD